MSLRISVFTSKMMKNYILPQINNLDYSIILDKDKFGLNDNIVLEMQVIDDKWSFKKSGEYKLTRDSRDSIFEPLKHDDLFTLRRDNEATIKISVSNAELSFDNLKKYTIDKNMSITIGRSSSSTICYDMQDFISKNHAVIICEKNEWQLIDKSKNGVFIEGERVNKSRRLNNGDRIEIYGLKIIFFNTLIAVSTDNNPIVNTDMLKPYVNKNSGIIVRSDNEPEKKYFHRAPRNKEKIYRETIEIEPPPTLRRPEEKPLLMTIGPSLTMAIPMLLGCGMAIMSSRMSGGASSAFMYTGIITAMGSAIIGTIWTLVNLRYARKQFDKAEEARFNAYGQYLINIADKIKDMYETNVKSLNIQYPSAQECCKYDGHSHLLWNRNASHEDMMYYRLGIGEMPFQTQIQVPKEKFKIDNDELEKKPQKIYDEYKTLYNIPLGIDLAEHKIIGIVGGENKAGAFELVKCLSAQIAASNSYTDIKMAFVYNEEHEINRQWRFAKWFPHVWMEEKKGRFIASNKTEASNLFFTLTGILRMRSENHSGDFTDKKKLVRPHYVLFIEDMSWLEGEPVSKYINEGKDEYGLTTIIMAEKYSDLPNKCDYIIYNNDEFKGIYDVNNADDGRINIEFDSVSVGELEKFARTIMNVEVAETEVGGEIASSLNFFEMYSVKKLTEFDVLSRWKKNRTYDSMKALIGTKAGGASCYLDIHEKYHGPHGLVAGTTGSGKSETLQTYMLSLAINFSPYDIAFFVIDFKGGGMANLFSDLPHSIGQISNLSGNQVRRAMVSIKSENMRRQRIFSENGVNNINSYTKLLKNNEAAIPIPHLFIIIDEFAELKKEEPEFMKELISVAQVGRSLGVHLILATQKPSGTVDDNIWSNSKFRLCLRVQDRQDSKDMLHKPDAAYITQAGRGYLQVGNDEVYDYFQSGWSGAVYSENTDDVTSDIVTLMGLDGKAEMVGNKMRIQQKEQTRLRWFKALEECVMTAAQECGEDIAVYAPNSSVSNNMLTKVIENIHNAGFKFDDTVYNRRRIDDFIELWNQTSAEENHIKALIEMSENLGIKMPEIKEITQLDAVVAYLKELAIDNNYKKSMQLWLPVLPEKLYLDNLSGYKESVCAESGYISSGNSEWTLEAFVGLYDDPANQAQNPVILDFAQNGHHAVCGMVVSGKSTFMQTVIYSLISRYSPEHVNFYLIDFSSKMMSAFENSTHVGGVMYENDTEKIVKFFNMIALILKERKELFKGGNYAQYVRVHGVTIPSIFICIDNYGGFRAKTNNAHDEFLLQLSSEGVGYGIYLILTSGGFGSNEIPNSLGDNIKSTVSLEMGDKFKYGEVLKTMKFDVMPETNIRGRGLVNVNDNILEFQTALSLEAMDDYSRLEEIKRKCEIFNSMWKGASAKRIPEIPEKPTWADIKNHESYNDCISDDYSLPIAYNENDASIYSIDLRKTYCYILSGKRKTGKSNMLKIIACAFKEKDTDVCIIDNNSNEMRAFANSIDAEYVADEEDMCGYFEKLLELFIPRNKQKKELIAQGADEEKIYNVMKAHRRTAVLINDFESFSKIINKPLKNNKYDFKGILENLFEKGFLHNIYFAAAISHESTASLTGTKLYSSFIADKQGILMGGDVITQKIFDFSDLKFAEQSKVYKAGTGFISSGDGTEKIILPIYMDNAGGAEE